MTTRRALTQALAGLSADQLWAPIADSSQSLGDIAQGVWEHEGFWLWPAEVPSPELEIRPSVEGLLYALVRHRGVTEQVLMDSGDDDLDRVYVSEARSSVEHEPTPLGRILETVLRGELFAAAEMGALRLLVDPSWVGNREAWDNAAEAVARSRMSD